MQHVYTAKRCFRLTDQAFNLLGITDIRGHSMEAAALVGDHLRGFLQGDRVTVATDDRGAFTRIKACRRLAVAHPRTYRSGTGHHYSLAHHAAGHR